LVLEAKYDSLSGGWCSKEVEGIFGVGVWKHIRRGWGVFSRYIIYEVGDGSKIHFWHDAWCGDQLLKEASRSYLVLLVERRRGLWTTCCFPMALFSGMCLVIAVQD
jgi:hypothetical protein